MEIVEIKQSDDLLSVARKCALNFRRLAVSVEQSVRKQDRIIADDIMKVITELADDVADLENTKIPNEVAAQIAAQNIPGMVSSQIAAQNIPGMVSSQIAAQNIPGQVEDATRPAMGTYVMADSRPSHSGTSWTQVGTVEVTGGSSVKLWQRTG